MLFELSLVIYHSIQAVIAFSKQVIILDMCQSAFVSVVKNKNYIACNGMFI